jgi:hypothetical protein
MPDINEAIQDVRSARFAGPQAVGTKYDQLLQALRGGYQRDVNKTAPIPQQISPGRDQLLRQKYQGQLAGVNQNLPQQQRPLFDNPLPALPPPDAALDFQIAQGIMEQSFSKQKKNKKSLMRIAGKYGLKVKEYQPRDIFGTHTFRLETFDGTVVRNPEDLEQETSFREPSRFDERVRRFSQG